MALIRGSSEPGCRSFKILCGAVTEVVHAAKIELRLGMVLFSSLREPLRRFTHVLRYTLTFLVHQRERIFGIGIPESGRLAEQIKSSADVLRYSVSVVVQRAQIVLGHRVILISCFPVPSGGRSRVFADTFTARIHHGEVELGVHAALLRSFRVPFRSR